MQLSADFLRNEYVGPVLRKMFLDNDCTRTAYSESAENLLLGTIAHESLMGKFRVQMFHGPALGICQIEPRTYWDIIDNYLSFRNRLRSSILNLSGHDNFPNEEELIEDDILSISIARCVYLRQKEALPKANDIDGLAKYWKKYYNTVLGKGKVKDFIRHYNMYINE